MALSLIDIHVEHRSKNCVFLNDHMYAVSVTPAVSLIMAYLAGFFLDPKGDWRDLESLVGAYLCKKALLEQNVTRCLKNVPKLITLGRKYPSHTKDVVQVPLIADNVVYVSAMEAPFADVFTRNTLVQSKFTQYEKKAARLEIEKELRKMGVLNEPNFKHGAYLSALLDSNNWNKALWNKVDPGGDLIKRDHKKHRTVGYPQSLLLHKLQKSELPTIEGRYDTKNILSVKVGKSVKKYACNDVISNLTVEFLTNANGFTIAFEKDGDTNTIGLSSKDTNSDGYLRNDHEVFRMLKAYGLLLREGVQLKFTFF